MSVAQLTSEALALPPAERVNLAQTLWESLGPEWTDVDEAAIDEALRRDAELSNGTVTGLSHEEVMKEVRRAAGLP